MLNNYRSKLKKHHKQSKYFTIMLVPHSSGKTRSLRIPLMAFYVVSSVIAASLICFASFVFATNHFKSVAEAAHSDLEQSVEINSNLKRETNKLSDLLDSEKRGAEEASAHQREQYEEIIGGYEVYYKQKAEELELKLEELDKAREEIYNILSKKTYLPAITPVTVPGGRAETAFLSTGVGGSYNAAGHDIPLRYEMIEQEIEEWQIYFDHLMGELEAMKPYLDNYPITWPVRGKVTSEHAYRRNPFTGRGSEFHYGIDIVVPTGTNVRATGGGRVIASDWQPGYGYTVDISHGFGLVTRYAHNSRLVANVGDYVSRGDIIAKSGSTGRSTGPHVHYEVIQNGASVNPRRFLE
jgi:murein DD-endopeptidase MepM/ murein hydrolase activator NlpD